LINGKFSEKQHSIIEEIKKGVAEVIMNDKEDLAVN